MTEVPGGGMRRARGATVRVAGVVVVFALAVGAFASGVHTSGVEDATGRSLVAWIYYAAGLFVFGGLDLGAPVGGPTLGRAALWFAYFLAPAITTTAVIDAALRLIKRDQAVRQSLEGHVVVAGGGQVGLAYLSAIRAVEPDRPVLFVEEGHSSARAEEAVRLGAVSVVQADLRRPATLELLRLEQADRMIAVTDDDLVNLELAWAAKDRWPDLPVAVHVADLSLLRPVNRLLRGSAREAGHGTGAPLVFNTHRISALHLYDRFLHPHFQDTGYRDVLVVAGFGRFAQTILELLRVTAADEVERVVIVDGDATVRLRQFTTDVKLGSFAVLPVDGAIEDPGTWDRVEASLQDLDVTPVYLLASNEEVVNFRTALMLRERVPEARIFARCFHRGRFSESLAEQRTFELLAFEEVLREALMEHFEGFRTV